MILVYLRVQVEFDLFIDIFALNESFWDVFLGFTFRRKWVFKKLFDSKVSINFLWEKMVLGVRGSCSATTRLRGSRIRGIVLLPRRVWEEERSLPKRQSELYKKCEILFGKIVLRVRSTRSRITCLSRLTNKRYVIFTRSPIFPIGNYWGLQNRITH